MAHAILVEGSDPQTRQMIESRFEPLGHEIRAAADEDYKRETWGLRPEDLAEQAALMAEMAGRQN